MHIKSTKDFPSDFDWCWNVHIQERLIVMSPGGVQYSVGADVLNGPVFVAPVEVCVDNLSLELWQGLFNSTLIFNGLVGLVH